MAQTDSETGNARTGPELPTRDTSENITGPHTGRDSSSEPYRYWRCETCGLETTDETLESDGCWRCNN